MYLSKACIYDNIINLCLILKFFTWPQTLVCEEKKVVIGRPNYEWAYWTCIIILIKHCLVLLAFNM